MAADKNKMAMDKMPMEKDKMTMDKMMMPDLKSWPEPSQISAKEMMEV